MAGQAVTITDEVFQVGGPALTAPEDAAIYLVAVGNHAALVDAGCGRGLDRLLANVAAAGVTRERIETLLVTHCHFDHTGGAADLRERLGCRVMAHELDAPFIEQGDDQVTAATWYGARLRPCPVDRRLTGGADTVDLGGRPIEVLHIPGHSPGSVAYVMDSAGQIVAFAQDVHGPLHPSLLSDRDDYLASLQRLIDLDADILCEGHYGIFRGRTEITRFIRSVMA